MKAAFSIVKSAGFRLTADGTAMLVRMVFARTITTIRKPKETCDTLTKKEETRAVPDWPTGVLLTYVSNKIFI